MRVEIMVPQIGEAVAELSLVAWHKRVGDKVEKGDLLFEIDSDKAIVEVEAFVAGRLTEILWADDSVVMPQQVVAIIKSADGAARVALHSEGQDSAESFGAQDSGNRTEDSSQKAQSLPYDETLRAADREHARPNISPKARRLAKREGVDWTNLRGSGVDGMILVGDVEREIQAASGKES